ncbi:acyltransferase family protein [Pantoea sp. Mb-10]|uniref:acyltransferase family protein n=1 Tax=unclassified Pantoea TaxID=2630326 RepID=UPI001E33AF6B|nr:MULTISPECIES: acyltransferase family protein [unclassified Pantoea]MCE0489616.1 acyltransferase family protein [Pantoea sp. Mb-10]MCE0502144.1 acyltransferase family protein [Pantoea sp. Pb-8]
MNNSTKNDIGWINTLKGACILLVVLYHTVLPGFEGTLKYLTAGWLPADMWVQFNTVLSPLRMPAFFFVSGLLATNGILNRTWKQVMTSRVMNLFYLYILWGVIQWWSIIGISSEITGQRISHNLNAAYAGSLIEFITLTFMAMSTSWYLYGLALYFLFAKLFRQHKGLLLTVAIAVNYLAVTKIIPFWGPQSVAQYFLFFLLGAFWSPTLLRMSEWHRQNLLPWALLVALGGVQLLFGLEKNLFLCTLAVMASVAVCRWLNQHFSMTVLNWIGRNTLQIYVIHRIFLEFFGMSAILLAQRYHAFEYAWFSVLWACLYPLAMVAICSLCSVAVWSMTNRGLGQSLFLFPTLITLKRDKSLG